jgi:hypothetical protein
MNTTRFSEIAYTALLRPKSIASMCFVFIFSILVGCGSSGSPPETPTLTSALVVAPSTETTSAVAQASASNTQTNSVQASSVQSSLVQAPVVEPVVVAATSFVRAASVERVVLAAAVNHEGRTLPAMPVVSSPVMFNTPQADAIVSAMQIFPKNSAWNEDISGLSVRADSDQMIARIGATLSLKFNSDMGYIIVPPSQPLVNVTLGIYASESDPGPYPMPDDAPVEGWPMDGSNLSVLQATGSGDRHVIVVDAMQGKLYEFGETYKGSDGWRAIVASKFDFSTNKLRPLTWTSTDAAGLPIFPAVIRFDEVERGMVEHAMRFTVPVTRKEFIYPATHQAGSTTDPLAPAMGQRFRLKKTANLTGLSAHALAVAKGLQKYGMIVADNGGPWRLSVAPDTRIVGLNDLQRFKGSDFEVIQTTPEFGGPRQ